MAGYFNIIRFDIVGEKVLNIYSDTESPGDTVLKCLTMLENYREHLLQILDERHALYDQCLHLALFNRDAEQAESWMTAQVCILFYAHALFITATSTILAENWFWFSNENIELLYFFRIID